MSGPGACVGYHIILCGLDDRSKVRGTENQTNMIFATQPQIGSAVDVG